MIRDKIDEYDKRKDLERQAEYTNKLPEPKVQEMKYPDGNPKTQFGIAKPGNYYTPDIPFLEYSMAHLQGALKYGPFNWRDDNVSISTYMEAAFRHMALYKGGQLNASDTGIHHLAHAMCCLSIIMDAEAYGSLIDDRWKPRDPEAHTYGNRPELILEAYVEGNQERVKAIRQQWTGFAERNKRSKPAQAKET